MLAYSAKVILSNMGMNVYLGEKLKLPLCEKDDEAVIEEALRPLIQKEEEVDKGDESDREVDTASRRRETKGKKNNNKDVGDAGSDGDDSDSEDKDRQEGAQKKRRKKSRGRKGR